MLETELLGERICQVGSFARLLRVALAVGGECAGAGCSSLEKSAPQAAPPPFPSVAGERVLGEAPEAWEGMISDFFGGPSRRAGEQGATYGDLTASLSSSGPGSSPISDSSLAGCGTEGTNTLKALCQVITKQIPCPPPPPPGIACCVFPDSAPAVQSTPGNLRGPVIALELPGSLRGKHARCASPVLVRASALHALSPPTSGG